MKKILMSLALTVLSLSASAKEIDMTQVWCGYWDNPSYDARMWVYFTQNEGQLVATVNRSRERDDESPVDALFSGPVKVVKKADRLMVFGGDEFQLSMKTPIAKWNKGSNRDSKLTIRSYGINTGIQCERKD